MSSRDSTPPPPLVDTSSSGSGSSSPVPDLVPGTPSSTAASERDNDPAIAVLTQRMMRAEFPADVLQRARGWMALAPGPPYTGEYARLYNRFVYLEFWSYIVGCTVDPHGGRGERRPRSWGGRSAERAALARRSRSA